MHTCYVQEEETEEKTYISIQCCQLVKWQFCHITSIFCRKLQLKHSRFFSVV